jgi:hypothetical protein
MMVSFPKNPIHEACRLNFHIMIGL